MDLQDNNNVKFPYTGTNLEDKNDKIAHGIAIYLKSQMESTEQPVVLQFSDFNSEQLTKAGKLLKQMGVENSAFEGKIQIVKNIDNTSGDDNIDTQSTQPLLEGLTSAAHTIDSKIPIAPAPKPT